MHESDNRFNQHRRALLARGEYTVTVKQRNDGWWMVWLSLSESFAASFPEWAETMKVLRDIEFFEPVLQDAA